MNRGSGQATDEAPDDPGTSPHGDMDGRMDGGCTSAFELICPSCGDHPYLAYSEIPARLQRIHGPYTMEAGLSA